MVLYKTIPQFARESGYSEKAIRCKINKGIWPEGIKVKAPDGRILISVEEYNKWVQNIKTTKNTKVSNRSADPRWKSTSVTKESNNENRSNVIPLTKRFGKNAPKQ